jgi:hypothetical protein
LAVFLAKRREKAYKRPSALPAAHGKLIRVMAAFFVNA